MGKWEHLSLNMNAFVLKHEGLKLLGEQVMHSHHKGLVGLNLCEGLYTCRSGFQNLEKNFDSFALYEQRKQWTEKGPLILLILRNKMHQSSISVLLT